MNLSDFTFYWLRLQRTVMLTCLLLVLGACAQNGALIAFQPSASENLVKRYPAGSIQSIEVADQALEEVSRARAGTEALFAEDERACYSKFFATSCLQNAKERRRYALAQLRRIEVEAGGFKRHARVLARDRDLAEKQMKDELEAPQRNNKKTDK